MLQGHSSVQKVLQGTHNVFHMFEMQFWGCPLHKLIFDVIQYIDQISRRTLCHATHPAIHLLWKIKLEMVVLWGL